MAAIPILVAAAVVVTSGLGQSSLALSKTLINTHRHRQEEKERERETERLGPAVVFMISHILELPVWLENQFSAVWTIRTIRNWFSYVNVNWDDGEKRRTWANDQKANQTFANTGWVEKNGAWAVFDLWPKSLESITESSFFGRMIGRFGIRIWHPTILFPTTVWRLFANCLSNHPQTEAETKRGKEIFLFGHKKSKPK